MINSQVSNRRSKNLLDVNTAKQMEELIKEGANLNIVDKDGNTPLMFARNSEETKVLIEAGSDVNKKIIMEILL